MKRHVETAKQNKPADKNMSKTTPNFMETETMKRHIQADSRINASGISHKKIVLERDNCIASPIIDAEKRTFAVVRQKLSKERHTAPILIANEDTGVLL